MAELKTNAVKKTKHFIIIIVSLLLSACNTPLNLDDNNSTVEFAINTPFEVELEANPTTGYQWHILSYDSSVIRQIGKPEFTGDSDKIGAPGYSTYKFETIAPGETTLLMVYTKAGQGNEEAFRKFSVNILSGTMGRITAN